MDPLEVPLGPMTRAKAKRFKKALHVLIRDAHVKEARMFNVECTKEQQLYRNLVPSGHTLLTFCIRIGTFDCFRVSGLVQVFRVSCIIVTKVRDQKANMDH